MGPGTIATAINNEMMSSDDGSSQRREVRGGAFHHFVNQRKALRRDHQRDHHLFANVQARVAFYIIG